MRIPVRKLAICIVGMALLVPALSARPLPQPHYDTAELYYLGSAVFPGDFYDVAYHNGAVYLADGRQSHSGNVKVLDVNDPSNPQLVASDSFPGYTVQRLAAADGLLAVSVPGYGLVLYDISEPLQPTRAGEWLTGDEIKDVVLRDGLAYLFGPIVDLTILDVSDPGSIQQVSQTVIPSGSCLAGAISDNDVVGIADGSRLRMYDVSDPAAPDELDPVLIDMMTMHEIAASGSYLFAGFRSSIVNSGGIMVFDVSDPQNVEQVAQRTVFGADVPPNVGMAVDGNTLHYTAGQTGLVAYDISDPASPTLISQFGEGVPWPPAVGSWQTRVAVGDGHAFTIMPDRQDWYTHNNLWVLDVSDPSDPVIAGDYDTPDYVSQVAGAGDVAYVAAEHDGLYTVDISDPFVPEVLGNVLFSELNFAARQIVHDDGYVYLNGAGLALAVVDVTVPDEPVLTAEVNTLMHKYTGLAKRDDLVAVTGWDAPPMPPGWMELYDVSNPAAPVLLSTLLTEMRTEAVALQGNFAYLATADGMTVVLVEDPAEPAVWATHPTNSQALDVAVAGETAFICDQQGRLYVVDITSPIVPLPLGEYELPEVAVDLEVHGDSLWITSEIDVRLVDVTDPSQPVPLDVIELDGTGKGCVQEGDRLLLSDTYGFHVHSTGETGITPKDDASRLPDEFGLTAYPNPFNAATTVTVHLPQSSVLRVEVVDLLGRHVISLHDGSLAAGRHEFSFEASGLASGVYFLHAQSADGLELVQKLTLVR